MCMKCREQLRNSKNRTDKNVQCADKNRMVLIRPPCQHDTCQSGLEDLDGRRHNDRSNLHTEDYKYSHFKYTINTGATVHSKVHALSDNNTKITMYKSHWRLKTYYSFLHYNNTSYLLFIYCLFFILYFIFIKYMSYLLRDGNSFFTRATLY